MMSFLKSIKERVLHTLDYVVLIARAALRPSCQHVIMRVAHPTMTGVIGVTLRCLEPADVEVCGMGYCIEHCTALCKCADGDGDDGDEEDADDPVTEGEWRPKKGADGRDIVQS